MMTRWIVWGAVLVVTNACSTLTSRARNTPSYSFHATTATLNHATWFIANVMLVGFAVDIGALQDPKLALAAWLYYTVCSTFGSIVSHYVSLNYFEKGNRRVGLYEEGHGERR